MRKLQLAHVEKLCGENLKLVEKREIQRVTATSAPSCASSSRLTAATGEMLHHNLTAHPLLNS